MHPAVTFSWLFMGLGVIKFSKPAIITLVTGAQGILTKPEILNDSGSVAPGIEAM